MAQAQTPQTRQTTRSNPKFPTLSGYRMRALWQHVRIELAHLRELVTGLERRRGLLREFRGKWGNSPPRSDAQWRMFWLELMAVEDQLDAARRDAQVITNEIDTLSAEALEIFEQNNVRVPAADHAQALEAIARRAKAALKRQTNG